MTNDHMFPYVNTSTEPAWSDDRIRARAYEIATAYFDTETLEQADEIEAELFLLRDAMQARITELESKLAEAGQWEPVEQYIVWPCGCGNCTTRLEIADKYIVLYDGDNDGDRRSFAMPPSWQLMQLVEQKEPQP